LFFQPNSLSKSNFKPYVQTFFIPTRIQKMSSFRPFLVRLYWGGKVSHLNGVVTCDESTYTSSFIVPCNSMSYSELVDVIYNHVQLDRDSFSLKLLLYYTFQGIPANSYLFGEDGVNMLYYLAATELNFIGEIFVNWEPKNSIQPTRTIDLMHGFIAPQSHDYQIGAVSSYMNPENHIVQQPINDDAAHDVPNLEHNSEKDDTEDSEVSPSEDDSGDEVMLPPPLEQYNSGICQGFVAALLEDYDEAAELRDSELPDFDNEDVMDVWNPKANKIRVGMFFKSKDELVCAVRNWNVANNKECIVVETRPRVWRAKCYTHNPKYNDAFPNAPSCRWVASACLKKNQYMWQLTKWVDKHNCYGTVVRNNNRCLRSKDVAMRISKAIQKDISFPRETKIIRSPVELKEI
jgi:hypothetical protein